MGHCLRQEGQLIASPFIHYLHVIPLAVFRKDLHITDSTSTLPHRTAWCFVAQAVESTYE